eukprot:gene6289-4525_t
MYYQNTLSPQEVKCTHICIGAIPILYLSISSFDSFIFFIFGVGREKGFYRRRTGEALLLSYLHENLRTDILKDIYLFALFHFLSPSYDLCVTQIPIQDTVLIYNLQPPFGLLDGVALTAQQDVELKDDIDSERIQP